MKTADKVGLAGLAGIGGVMGYLYAGLLTTAEIVAVSNPVGIAVGALVFVGLGMDAVDRESGE